MAEVIRIGRSQAIRLPKGFRVDADRVYLKHTAHGFEVFYRDPWKIFFEGVRELSEGFMEERVQPKLESRD
jgi:antitoxin VapB